jgi:hypothetical protein
VKHKGRVKVFKIEGVNLELTGFDEKYDIISIKLFI